MNQHLHLVIGLALLAGCGGDGDGLPPCSKPQPEASCASGSCIGEAWTAGGGKLGEACALSKDCQSGLCAADPASTQKYCTQSCDPKVQGSCPNGAECLVAENKTDSTVLNVCGPPACR